MPTPPPPFFFLRQDFTDWPGTRPGWPQNSLSVCLCLPNAGINGVRHHAWRFFILFWFCFYSTPFLESGFDFAAQASLKLESLLPQPPEG